MAQKHVLTACIPCLTNRNRLVGLNTLVVKATERNNGFSYWSCPECRAHGERDYGPIV